MIPIHNVEQPLPSANPEDEGMSPAVLSGIRPLLGRYVDAEMGPNFVTLVIRHGKIVHHEAQGFMDFKTRRPVMKDALFRLYSNTKPVTGAAAMICVEEGLLALDDPVGKYIPSFRNQRVRAPGGQGPVMVTPTVPVERDMTVRDCLRNTTGLVSAHNAPLAYMVEYKDVILKAGLLTGPDHPRKSVRETVNALGQLPLAAQPGTTYEYHAGYPVMGVILETVTGKSLEDFYQERILRPLGMKDTSFHLDKAKIDRLPTLYTPVPEKGKWQLRVQERPEKNERLTGRKVDFDAGGGDGGLLCTAADYARFGQMLLNGGELDGVRILSRKSVEMMTACHTGDMVIDIPGPGYGFGLGVGVYKGGGDLPPEWRSVGTFGWGGAAGTNFFADPKEDLIAIIFGQVLAHGVMPGNNYQEDFERLVYQSLM